MPVQFRIPPGHTPYDIAHALDQAYTPESRRLLVRPFLWIGSWFRWLIPHTDAEPRAFTVLAVPNRLVCTCDPAFSEKWGVSCVTEAPDTRDISTIVLLGGRLSEYRWAFDPPIDDITQRHVYLVEVEADCRDLMHDPRVHVHIVTGDVDVSPRTRIPRSPGGAPWDISARVYEDYTAAAVVHGVLSLMATGYSV